MSSDSYSSFDEEFSQGADGEDIFAVQVSTGEVVVPARSSQEIQGLNVPGQPWDTTKTDELERRKSEEDILLSSTGDVFDVATSSVGSEGWEGVQVHDERKAGGNSIRHSGVSSYGTTSGEAEEENRKGMGENPKTGGAIESSKPEIDLEDSPRSTRERTEKKRNEPTTSALSEASESEIDPENSLGSAGQKTGHGIQQGMSEQETSDLDEESESEIKLKQDPPLSTLKKSDEIIQKDEREQQASDPMSDAPKEISNPVVHKLLGTERSHSFAGVERTKVELSGQLMETKQLRSKVAELELQNRALQLRLQIQEMKTNKDSQACLSLEVFSGEHEKCLHALERTCDALQNDFGIAKSSFRATFHSMQRRFDIQNEKLQEASAKVKKLQTEREFLVGEIHHLNKALQAKAFPAEQSKTTNSDDAEQQGPVLSQPATIDILRAKSAEVTTPRRMSEPPESILHDPSRSGTEEKAIVRKLSVPDAQGGILHKAMHMTAAEEIHRLNMKIRHIESQVWKEAQRVETAERRLSHATMNVRRKEQEILNLNDRFENLQEEHTRKLEKMASWATNLSSQIEKGESKRLALKEEIESLHHRMDERDKERAALQKELKAGQQRARDMVMAARSERDKAVRKCKIQVDGNATALKLQGEEIGMLRELSQQRGAAFEAKDKEANLLRIELGAESVKVKDLKSQLEQVKSQLEKSSSRAWSSEKASNLDREAKEKVEKALEESRSQVLPLLEANRMLERKIRKLEEEKADVETRLAKLDRAKGDVEEAMAEAAMDTIKAKKDRLVAQEQRRGDGVKLEAAIADLQGLVEAKQGEIKLLQNRLHAAVANASSLSDKLASLSSSHTSLQAELQASKMEVHVLHESLSCVQSERESYARLLRSRRGKTEGLEVRTKELEQWIVVLRREERAREIRELRQRSEGEARRGEGGGGRAVAEGSGGARAGMDDAGEEGRGGEERRPRTKLPQTPGSTAGRAGLSAARTGQREEEEQHGREGSRQQDAVRGEGVPSGEGRQRGGQEGGREPDKARGGKGGRKEGAAGFPPTPPRSAQKRGGERRTTVGEGGRGRRVVPCEAWAGSGDATARPEGELRDQGVDAAEGGWSRREEALPRKASRRDVGLVVAVESPTQPPSHAGLPASGEGGGHPGPALEVGHRGGVFPIFAGGGADRARDVESDESEDNAELSLGSWILGFAPDAWRQLRSNQRGTATI